MTHPAPEWRHHTPGKTGDRPRFYGFIQIIPANPASSYQNNRGLSPITHHRPAHPVDDAVFQIRHQSACSVDRPQIKGARHFLYHPGRQHRRGNAAHALRATQLPSHPNPKIAESGGGESRQLLSPVIFVPDHQALLAARWGNRPRNSRHLNVRK